MVNRGSRRANMLTKFKSTSGETWHCVGSLGGSRCFNRVHRAVSTCRATPDPTPNQQNKQEAQFDAPLGPNSCTKLDLAQSPNQTIGALEMCCGSRPKLTSLLDHTSPHSFLFCFLVPTLCFHLVPKTITQKRSKTAVDHKRAAPHVQGDGVK